MTLADLPAVERLVAGRNLHRDEYPRFLELEGAQGLVLEDDGVVVGATTLFRGFERAILGPVLLAAPFDSGGAALALLGAAVERLQRQGVTLVEAEAGQGEVPLLEAMGFHAVRCTRVMERPPGPVGPNRSTRAMVRADLLDVGALDADAVGHGRKGFISMLMGSARVSEGPGGDITGFVITRRGLRGYHLGPLVTRAVDPEEAARLAADAVAEVSSWPVVALAPDGGALAPHLRDLGFEDVGTLWRMRAGTAAAPEVAHEWLVGSRLTG